MIPAPSTDAVFCFDTSALVKRYAAEAGSSWVNAVCRASTGNTVATAQITHVEAAAAFAVKRRHGELSHKDYTNALQDLAHDFMYEYLIVKIDQSLVELAVELTKHHKLRGYDAVQLAAALTLNSLLTQTPFTPLTFVTADDELLQAAESEGLLAANPNQHPD